jgi:hypothetical protein
VLVGVDLVRGYSTFERWKEPYPTIGRLLRTKTLWSNNHGNAQERPTKSGIASISIKDAVREKPRSRDNGEAVPNVPLVACRAPNKRLQRPTAGPIVSMWGEIMPVRPTSFEKTCDIV